MNSKELLEKTGISRATLNNYISWGIVPKPEVLPPEPQDGAAPRIGYFPDEVVARIADIQRLKREGWSITKIAEHFAAGPKAAAVRPAPLQASESARTGPALEIGTMPSLALDEIARPAQDLSRPSVRPELVTGQPGGKRLPELSHVAVLAADLQHPTRIWTELPPEEYFELINQIWLMVDPIFRRHHGTHGKHAGDGMVGCFFPQPDSNYVWNALMAACEMREAMRRVSKEWQLRKRWATELYMNTGLDEGQQWFGVLKSAGQVEFTMLGDTFTRAARISDFASFGAIWATKNLIGKLGADDRQRLKFGVRRRDTEGREVLVPSIFSDVGSLADAQAGPFEKLKDIARLPIAEIVELAASDKRRDGAVEQNPI